MVSGKMINIFHHKKQGIPLIKNQNPKMRNCIKFGLNPPLKFQTIKKKFDQSGFFT